MTETAKSTLDKPALLILFRHGQTDFNAERRFQGQGNMSLNANGQAEANRTGSLLANLLREGKISDQLIKQCLTSDLPRSFETSQIVAHLCSQDAGCHLNFIPTPALREFHTGALSSHTFNEYEQKHPAELSHYLKWYESDRYAAHYPGEGGESRFMVMQRLSPLVQALNQSSIETRERAISIWSTHGGIIDVLFELLNTDLGGKQRLVGNGDVVLLTPGEPNPRENQNSSKRPASGTLSPTKFSEQLGCLLGWKILRHYQVGNNIAAQMVRQPSDPVAP